MPRKKRIIPVKEKGIRMPDGLPGNRQYILFSQNDRLACVMELVGAIGQRELLSFANDQSELIRLQGENQFTFRSVFATV